jgi:peptidyl-prolyl cis-trans isomerase SurA
MKKKIIFYILIISYLCLKQVSSIENKIIIKVNNEIITSFDLEQEEKYLVVLNQSLKKIDKNKLKILATDSIIKETIKEIELIKFFQLENALEDPILSQIIQNLYQTIGFQSEKEFENYLQSQNLNFKSVKKKLAIEMLWNNLIFEKFNNRIIIDELEIKDNLDKDIKKIGLSKDLFLSEILIKNSKDLKLDSIYSEILKSIKDVGFATTANIFSKSDSAKIGGKIGWIKETSLSNRIQKILINLKKGQISKPIKLNENYLILRIDDVKFYKKNFNKEEILSKRILYEKNQQLEQFSLAYFNKIKQNTQINEF